MRGLSWTEMERWFFFLVSEVIACCMQVDIPCDLMTSEVILRRAPRRRHQRLADVCLGCGWVSWVSFITALTQCEIRVSTCLMVLMSRIMMNFFVHHAALPWRSFLTYI